MNNDSALSENAMRSDNRKGDILMEEQEPDMENIDSTADTAPEVEEKSTAERTFTQNEVNALLAKESSRLKRKLRKQNNATPQEEAPSEESSATVQALEKILGRLERLETDSAEKSREVAFETVVGGREMDEDVRNLLQRTFDPEHPELTTAMLEKLAPITTNPTGYQSPGAPSQSRETDHGPNPLTWTQDDIEILVREGRFLESIEKWRETLPGGGSNLLSRKMKRK